MEKGTKFPHSARWRRAALALPAAVLLCAGLGQAQRSPNGAAAVAQSIERLRVTGSVLMIAAHPDDENTAFLAWCAKQRKLRTAYLSITRGEGGQNLIGSEQGDLMGVIRTQELLAARRIDGGEQFFTRAIDFGFSKTAEETLAKWGREEVLGDVVWTIRRFRPDVIVLRFSGTQRDGHGHHQSSSILGKEAFRAAADPQRFPEQLRFVEPWQARRIVWNGFSFNRQQEQELESATQRLSIDTGEFDPLLGYSYGEIAGMSRSQHRSQGMGAAERKGSLLNYFLHVDGQPAAKDLFEEIDTTWRRIPGGAAVDAALAAAAEHFDFRAPDKALPSLLKARAAMAAIDHPEARRKLKDLDETIASAAGLWLEVSAARRTVAPGGTVGLDLTAVNRTRTEVTLEQVNFKGATGVPALLTAPAPLAYNQPKTAGADWSVPASEPYSQPYWLAEPRGEYRYSVKEQRMIGLAEGPAVLTALFHIRLNGVVIEVARPVENRYVDRVRGELTRPLVVAPPVALSVKPAALVFATAAPREVAVELEAAEVVPTGVLRLAAPAGWSVDPASQPFTLREPGEVSVARFRVTPPAAASRGKLSAVALVGGREIAVGATPVTYEHIPPQMVFPPASAVAVRADVRVAAGRVGYVMGAGDDVPAALEQLGCEVKLLTENDLARGDLSRYDAIVTGVRAFNVRADLRAAAPRLHAFAAGGGTLVVQYNILEGGPFASADSGALKGIGPLPIRVSRDRVTVEDAPVRLLEAGHPLLKFPNAIGPADFAGWVQERGLYFPSGWDPGYTALFETGDPGEKPSQGALLYLRHGKGAYVFSPLAFFRQLPAGVPGAYRLFANLISAAKAPQQ